jgi:hypothetical protein
MKSGKAIFYKMQFFAGVQTAMLLSSPVASHTSAEEAISSKRKKCSGGLKN